MIQPVTASKNLIIAIAAFIFLIVLAGMACADCQVTLQWDPNDPAPDGYRLYCRMEGQAYDYGDYIDAGESTTSTVTGLDEETTYYFVVRAYVGDDVSGDSNEVVFNPSDGGGIADGDANPPDQPYTVEPVDNAQDVALQPTLVSSTYDNSDSSDDHAESRWQIYRMDDDSCVLDLTSDTDLTSLTVSSSVLEGFTVYYWTVRYISENGGVSDPAEPSTFTTQWEEEEDTDAGLTTNTTSSGSGGGSGAGCFLQTALGQ
jgi:hypothetical protein